MFIVDYSTDFGKTVTQEEFTNHIKAEARAKYLSKKMHQGGYDGPTVYVFKKVSPKGQKAFFAGRIIEVENGYLEDSAE